MSINYTMSTMIGESIVGMPYPILFDTHHALLNNNGPMTLITGSPGSGKTFFGLILAAHASILGKMNFIIDPKNDFKALKHLERKGYLKNVNLWSLIDENNEIKENNIGMLDPTCFYDDINNNENLTLDIIKQLVPGIEDKMLASLTPIIRDVVKDKEKRSLMNVVFILKKQKDDALRSIGFSLESALKSNLGKILSVNQRKEKRTLHFDENSTTVIGLMGIDIPPSNKPSKDYSIKERISICIMTLISNIILDVMINVSPSIYKTLFIDEAWTLMATQSGRNMISTVSLLGRSKNMALIGLSQSPKHFDADDNLNLDTTISNRFAFKNKSDEDNEITCRKMKLPQGEGWQSILSSKDIQSGQCLMQDNYGNIALIHVMAQNDWVDLFSTNPMDLMD